MYCSNCGAEISEKAATCSKCGVIPFHIKNYCYNCGQAINAQQEMCVACGVLLKKSVVGRSTRKHKAWVIALLSFLLSGLGQIVVGQTIKGITMLVISLLLSFITAGFSTLVTMPFSVIDGYLIGKKHEVGKEIGAWEFF